MRYDTENETQYIKQADREDAHDMARDRAIDTLWYELDGVDYAEVMCSKWTDTEVVSGKLVTLIAAQRKKEQKLRDDKTLLPELRGKQMKIDRCLFVTELQTAVEGLFEGFINREIDNEN